MDIGFKLRVEKYHTLENTDEKILDAISTILSYRLHKILSLIENCESPIEKLLAIGMHVAFEITEKKYACDIKIIPQQEINTESNKYRVDFLVVVKKSGKVIDEIVVECDGHNFHERTKEQAAKDKSKDRNLIQQGFKVLRFTGSEIWRSHLDCAEEVMRIIEKTLDEHM